MFFKRREPEHGRDAHGILRFVELQRHEDWGRPGDEEGYWYIVHAPLDNTASGRLNCAVSASVGERPPGFGEELARFDNHEAAVKFAIHCNEAMAKTCRELAEGAMKDPEAYSYEKACAKADADFSLKMHREFLRKRFPEDYPEGFKFPEEED